MEDLNIKDNPNKIDPTIEEKLKKFAAMTKGTNKNTRRKGICISQEEIQTEKLGIKLFYI